MPLIRSLHACTSNSRVHSLSRRSVCSKAGQPLATMATTEISKWSNTSWRVFNVFPLKVCAIYSLKPSQQPTHLQSWTKLLGHLNSRPLPPSPRSMLKSVVSGCGANSILWTSLNNHRHLVTPSQHWMGARPGVSQRILSKIVAASFHSTHTYTISMMFIFEF